MKNLLDLVSSKTEEISKIVKIVKKIGNTSYSVIENNQKQYIVESTDEYLPGQTVVIKRGLILGKTKSTQTYKEIVVWQLL